MLPRVRLESAGHGIDAAFARALPVAHSFDLDHPDKAMLDCMRFADIAFQVELAGANPLGWSFSEALGLELLNGATSQAATCFGELPDQDFAQRVLLPTYLEAIAADQPVVHQIAAVANNTLLSYRRLTVPLYQLPRASRASHLLVFMRVHFAIPQIRSRGEAVSPLTFRERQCLSLSASGLMAKQMAAQIGVSEKTIELHLARARNKLGAHTTTQAVAINLAMAMMGS